MNRTTMNLQFKTNVCVIMNMVRISFVNIFTGTSKRECDLRKIYVSLA